MKKDNFDFYIGNKRNIIIGCILLGLLVSVLYILRYFKHSPTIFWLFVILFISTVVKSFNLLTKKNLFLISPKEIEKDSNKSNLSNHKYNPNSMGVFQYSKNGFSVTINKKNIKINWDEIQTILAYKKDLVTIDTICMDIICSKRTLSFCEEIDGWFQFILRIKKEFGSIPSDWDFVISTPPFERNLTLLYDYRNRSLEHLLKEKK